jgi:hypothetical protein
LRPLRPHLAALAALGAICAAACSSAMPIPTASPASTGRTYYVSRAGSNGDGRSWAAAWSEVDQIGWDQVRPGDTVLLDGGPTEMVYTTTLAVRASGTADAPVTVRLAAEPGRDGRAVLFGGRAARLPYYGQPRAEYAEPGGTSQYGLTLGTDQVRGGTSVANVVVDGRKWGGIRIHGAREAGVKLWAENDHVTLRNLEIDDNGVGRPDPATGGATWYPDNPGIVLAGTNLLFERLDVHDNGQDAVQSSGSSGTRFARLTVRGCWLHATRTRPSDGMIWNMGPENHPDGIQIFSGGEQRGLTIERSVVGPLLMHGLILGDAGCADDRRCDWAVVHGLTVRQSLFYGNWNGNIHGGDSSGVPGRPLPRGWLIDRVTSDLGPPGADDRAPSGSPWNSHVDFDFGAANARQLTVNGSIFTGGWGAQVPAAGRYTRNVQTGRREGAPGVDGSPGGVLGPATDPGYADPTAYGSRAPAASFALGPGSPAAGRGSPVTGPAQIVRQT